MIILKSLNILDSTLRDGSQAEGISLSVEDKLRIAQRLVKFGIHYIEGGWPGSNPKDIAFFKEIKNLKLKRSKVTAFGSTRRDKYTVEQDPNIQALVDAGTPTITLFGKSWDLHVRTALKVPLRTNLDLIRDSVAFLKAKKKEVIYDAEHYFDGYKDNPEYALKSIETALDAGADHIVLCDTNGGTLPGEVREAVIAARESFSGIKMGIHTHNDGGLAVANSIAAVEEGVEHVQGTINGIGERCGNANLCTLIPILQLKMGYKVVSPKNLRNLTVLSRFVSELANIKHDQRLPFVGRSAFAHKGGVHVSAVKRNPRTYEHIPPETVGNKQRILLSDLSGRSNILSKAAELDIKLDMSDPVVNKTLKRIKELENQGYQFEGADGSFNLLIKEAQGKRGKYFDLLGYRVVVEKRPDLPDPFS
ncbi:MAG: citramalate synthase, partial [Candidatus Ranarchaeia archaeon]